MVDKLAKKAARNVNMLPHDKFIFFEDILHINNQDIIDKCINGFLEQSTIKGWTYFNRVKEKGKRLFIWYEEYKDIPRNLIICISRLRMGHVTLAGHLGYVPKFNFDYHISIVYVTYIIENGNQG